MSKHEYDGADEAHGVDMVTGGDAGSMLETFSEFVADCGENEQKLINGGSTWLRDTPSDADLLKTMLNINGRSTNARIAALDELLARYLASPQTRRVIAKHAQDWTKEQQEIMLEGAL